MASNILVYIASYLILELFRIWELKVDFFIISILRIIG